MLNQRMSDLLTCCVEQYIKMATPVTSSDIERRDGNEFSSATIRNDMKTLDQMGYLRQLHTSGGRVPTLMGYKVYIDNSPETTFVGDIVNDLYTLMQFANRIEKKLFGTGCVNTDVAEIRRKNIHRMLEVPDVDMSAFYLILKERMNGRK